MWLYERLMTKTYKHGGYTSFYVTEPKLRKVEASAYIKGMHRAALAVQNGMKKCKKKYGEYYILKMDIAKYFASINKEKLDEIISRKIKDEDVLWLLREIIYSKKDEVGIPIRKFNESNFCKCIL